MAAIKPIVLLADSQLLFWHGEEGSLLARVRDLLNEDEEVLANPRAAYLGASNGDAPEFYQLFQAAMEGVGIRECRMVPAEPAEADRAFLAEADLILLAGGDVLRGWRAFEAAGIKDKIVERYYGGALLLGVSAGAIQLGLKGADEASETLFDTFRLVPFVVDVHGEPGWPRLLAAVPRAGEHARGFGIPTGGGALYHPDHSVEPVRHPLTEFWLTEEGEVRQALLFPGETSEAADAPQESPAGKGAEKVH
ncbi:MAG TPA: Type 1 glutamine amidotransferase-like domain-containing protein [Thermoanaerobaculia bacterium]|nr:Type 1 glutamine amidotransferase-like domain-containing protein [Thermoanaerobaculia bacterium]